MEQRNLKFDIILKSTTSGLKYFEDVGSCGYNGNIFEFLTKNEKIDFLCFSEQDNYADGDKMAFINVHLPTVIIAPFLNSTQNLFKYR